jgi:hypothetical protein
MDKGGVTVEAVVQLLSNMAADIQKASLGEVRNRVFCHVGIHNQTNPAVVQGRQDTRRCVNS